MLLEKYGSRKEHQNASASSLLSYIVHPLLVDLQSVTDAIPFGGVPVILGGDFAQILPVVPHGSGADIVNVIMHASRSHLYGHGLLNCAYGSICGSARGEQPGFRPMDQ